jgi:hypothetical protein
MHQSHADLANLKRASLAATRADAQLSAPGALDRLLAGLAPDVVWSAGAPVGALQGREAVGGRFWAPLLAALPDLERRPDLVMAGAWAQGRWTAQMGHFLGVFERDLFGVPATRRPVWLRYGAFERHGEAGVEQAYWLLDLPGLMMQAGVWPLAPGLGLSGVSPAPASQDGLSPALGAPEDSAASLALVERMIAGLMQYDGVSLSSMGMRRFWTDRFGWYGPAGIGTMRGHEDYERGHQRPFLTAFPDRKGGDHKCRIGDGAYVGSTGWPSIRATHTGGGFMGLAPTGRPVTMRVMDFWRREGDLLCENWVFIDLIDLLGQMGLDVFARMGEMIARR